MAKMLIMKYQTNVETTGSAIVCGIKVAESRKSAVGSEAGGNLPKNYMLVESGRNRRSCGIKPRGYTGVPTTGGGASIFVPILTKASWDALKDNDKKTVGGKQYTITKVDEKGYKG